MSEAYREPGSDAALRWMFAGKIWSGRAVKVVEDGPERTLISWWPGCESWRPEGMLHRAERGIFHWAVVGNSCSGGIGSCRRSRGAARGCSLP